MHTKSEAQSTKAIQTMNNIAPTLATKLPSKFAQSFFFVIMPQKMFFFLSSFSPGTTHQKLLKNYHDSSFWVKLNSMYTCYKVWVCATWAKTFFNNTIIVQVYTCINYRASVINLFQRLISTAVCIYIQTFKNLVFRLLLPSPLIFKNL